MEEVFMRKACASVVLVVALAAAACESNTQFLDANQSKAVETAVSRGKFELNCPAVTPSVLSREVVEPALMGPRAYGIDRAEYTIGISGCNDRKTFVVICPDGGDGCFAAGPGRFYGEP
jgi:hypothetical protein